MNDGAGIGVSSVLGTGNAGNLQIQTDELTVNSGSFIAANSEGGGSGGRLDIQAQSVLIQGTSVDGSMPSTLLTDIAPNSKGTGGELKIKTDTLQVLDGGQIRAGTRGDQDAGSLDIQAKVVTIKGISEDNIPSTLAAQSFGRGASGTLKVQSDILTITDHAELSTTSLMGDGGDIRLNIQEVLFLNQQGQISSTARLGGNAQTMNDGGNIDIKSGFIIAPPEANSDITANAVNGLGGNISLQTQKLLGIALSPTLSPRNDINASSDIGLDGTIVLQGLSLIHI